MSLRYEKHIYTNSTEKLSNYGSGKYFPLRPYPLLFRSTPLHAKSGEVLAVSFAPCGAHTPALRNPHLRGVAIRTWRCSCSVPIGTSHSKTLRVFSSSCRSHLTVLTLPPFGRSRSGSRTSRETPELCETSLQAQKVDSPAPGQCAASTRRINSRTAAR